MEERYSKRILIESGHLKSWPRRSQASFLEHCPRLHGWLEYGLRLTGLSARGKSNALRPQVKHLRLTFDTLPAAFHGFRILHLSDLHVDGIPDLAEVLAGPLRSLKVDVCVLTGDYRFDTTGSCQQVYPPMARIVRQVQARHGIVGVLGNHDAAEMVTEFERLGIRMLMNEAMELRLESQSIWLLGVDDPHHYGCDDLPRALRTVPEQAFKILLVHTPEMLEDAYQSGIHLYLCGHTHGGQICLPLLGPLITHANCPRAYTRGAWQYKGMRGYTSPGVGCSGVVARFYCPPELVLIELCRTALVQSISPAPAARYPILIPSPAAGVYATPRSGE